MSQSSSHKIPSKDKNPPFAIGGQALIEGVMMRSPQYYTMAVRRSDNTIVVEARHYLSLTKRASLWALPLIRGMVVLIESMVLGTKALLFSQKILFEDLEKPSQKASRSKPKHDNWFQKLSKGLFMVAYFAFIFALAIFLFKFLPLSAAQSLSNHFSLVADHYWIFNLIDGLTKVLIFVLYILVISFLPDIQRVFAYHGAEHQAIWAYEKGKPLTIADAQKEHPEHPRCGTSFIILVLLISVLVYTLLPADVSFSVKLLQRVAILPVLAGLSYEVLKISSKYEHHWAMHWVTLPGLWLQKITTQKPTDDMEEVAIAALEAALKAEEKRGA